MAKQITSKEVIDKYPKIFQIYEGNPGMINWASYAKMES